MSNFHSVSTGTTSRQITLAKIILGDDDICYSKTFHINSAVTNIVVCMFSRTHSQHLWHGLTSRLPHQVLRFQEIYPRWGGFISHLENSVLGLSFSSKLDTDWRLARLVYLCHLVQQPLPPIERDCTAKRRNKSLFLYHRW